MTQNSPTASGETGLVTVLFTAYLDRDRLDRWIDSNYDDEVVDFGFNTEPTIVGRLQSVLARVRTGTTQLVTDGGRPVDGSETQDEAVERVVFAEPYDEMPAKLEVLVGDAGFIVPASRRFPFKDRVLVQFDENKTGRAGGERHWIPEYCLDPEVRTDGGRSVDGSYRVNGHDFEVVLEFEGSVNVQCRECLLREHIAADRDDPEDYLDLMTPECQIEWLRRPDGEFHGVALRNASGFSGRELIGVKEGGDTGNGEVANTVRIYDDDRHQLASLLDMREWNRRALHTDTDRSDNLMADGGAHSDNGYQPNFGEQIVRGQLELKIQKRFSGHYNPTLVYFNGEWHYPITAETTFCGKEIPDPVIAVRNGEYGGPSTMGCATCRPPVAGVNKHDLKRQITKFLNSPMNKSGSFRRQALLEILMVLEERHRVEERLQPTEDNQGQETAIEQPDGDLVTDGGQLLQPSESSGSLAEYVEENREDVEALAETDLPIAKFMHRILDRYDRGEL